MIINDLGWGRLPANITVPHIQSGLLAHLRHLSADFDVDIFISRRAAESIGKVTESFWSYF